MNIKKIELGDLSKEDRFAIIIVKGNYHLVYAFTIANYNNNTI